MNIIHHNGGSSLMSMKKIPYGITDYKTLILEEYAYVDKTMYIRSLEAAALYKVFLRPPGFGKSLFTSMLGYYYDISEKDNFDFLFSNTDIGKNPTKRRNAYYVLKFKFSDIRTDSSDVLEEDFIRNVYDALHEFCARYNLDIHLEMDRSVIQITSFFTRFQAKCKGKIYVIIDDYDIFVDELLSSNPPLFEYREAGDAFVRTWYAGLKSKTGTIIDHIFITGISLNRLERVRSGFNISMDYSMRSGFNEMMGFTRTEVEHLIQETISEKLPANLMDSLTDYYGGYCFSEDGKECVLNSDMVLYYLDYYLRNGKPPAELFEKNSVSDYNKLEKFITSHTPEQNFEILQDIAFGGYGVARIEECYFYGQTFGSERFKTLLYFLGLLTLKRPLLIYKRLQIPNAVMTGVFIDFLMQIITWGTNYAPRLEQIEQAMNQLAKNSCEKLTDLIEELLIAISNYDSSGCSDKEIKIAIAAYAKISTLYIIKSEYEAEGKYSDLIFIPRDSSSDLAIFLFTLKYDQKNEETGETSIGNVSEVVEQLRKYDLSNTLSGKRITAWVIAFAGDKCVARVNVPVP